jgi:hypothetical protein
MSISLTTAAATSTPRIDYEKDALSLSALAALDTAKLTKIQKNLLAELLKKNVYAAILGKATIALYKLKNRLAHPDGKFDKGGRFYLIVRCPCCAGIRPPSRAHPFSEMAHARSALHVAAVWGVDATDLKCALTLAEANPEILWLAAN